MKENNNQPSNKREQKVGTKREVLKKLNQIDSRIKKSEQEIKQIELKWTKRKESIKLLKKDFEMNLQLLHSAPAQQED
jgi:uncharacterized protein (DUF342 family)